MLDETVRTNFVVAADVPDKLTELAGGERRRGDYITRIVRALHAGEQAGVEGAEMEQIRLTLMGLAAKGMVTESRLIQLERQLAAVIADKSG